jgi:hypothetical protein
MTPPRLLTSSELADVMQLSALDVANLKDAGAPARVVDGADRWSFAEFIEWAAAKDSARWDGIL